MELIDVRTIENYSINDDYYYGLFLKKHEEDFPAILKGINNESGYALRYEYRKNGIYIRTEEDKPVNLVTLGNKVKQEFEPEYKGVYVLDEVSMFDGRTLKITLDILDPYRLLYQFYYDEFKDRMISILNKGIEKTATRTDSKYFDLNLSPDLIRASEPLKYMIMLLEDIFRDSTIYKTKVLSPKDKSYTVFRVIWGEIGHEEEESAQDGQESGKEDLPPWIDRQELKKLSYMDRIREYAKRLVSKQ